MDGSDHIGGRQSVSRARAPGETYPQEKRDPVRWRPRSTVRLFADLTDVFSPDKTWCGWPHGKTSCGNLESPDSDSEPARGGLPAVAAAAWRQPLVAVSGHLSVPASCWLAFFVGRRRARVPFHRAKGKREKDKSHTHTQRTVWYI